MGTDGTVARHVTVHGRVQGVFFRSSTVDRASSHAVTGWVRNNPDGTLEAWLEGPADGVEAVERWMRDGGPAAADVDRVEVDDAEPAGHERFEVRR